MKQGWEIKKLGEVATYVNGYAFKPDHWADDGVPIIRIQNLNNQDAVYNYCNMDIPKKFVVEYGDILISWSASLGVYEWLGERSYLNQHIFKVVFDKCNINKYFFKYAVSSKINEMLKNAHGATMKHIVKKDFDNTEIIYPSIAEQERMVGELDCLSGIIANKRAQLRELDSLAQSIFYTMFGDPITNDKGWQTKIVGEICIHKKHIQRANKVFLPTSKIKYIDISSIDNTTNHIVLADEIIFSDAPSRAQQKVKYGDILISLVRPNLKNIAVLNYSYDNLVASSGFCILRTESTVVNKYYMLYVILYNSFTKYLMDRTSGANYPAVREDDIKQCKISVPPIDLQNEFAEKIENIERQKELITKSIKETEDLFNSRMSYYFD